MKINGSILVVVSIIGTVVVGSLCFAGFFPQTTAVVWSKLGPTSPVDKTEEELQASWEFRQDKAHFTAKAKTLIGEDLFAGVKIISERPIKVLITSIKEKKELKANQKTGFIGYSGQGVVVDGTAGIGLGVTKEVWWRASYTEGQDLSKGMVVELLPTSTTNAIYLPDPAVSLASNKDAK